jgi:nickel/cobalt transporter (NiCoT) family protein
MGTIELLQVFVGALNLNGPLAVHIAALDMTSLGYLIVAAFLSVWGVSVLLWKSSYN